MSVNPPWHISVVIPARNEERLLPRCLRSVFVAKKYLQRQSAIETGTAIEVDIVVVADSSTDQTAQLAADFLKNHGTVVQSAAGVVGSARALAVRTALARYPGPLKYCWLANTDADCMVPAAWLATQMQLAAKGIQAVAGTVKVDSFAEHHPRVRQRFDATYLVGVDGSHSHVHGANLGFSADAYRQAGGWGELATAEDHDLWRRFSLAGIRMLSTNRVEVTTSGRRIGRAPHGFAGALAAHNETAA
jgi:glycosyltransferase involved in cell wall biosynthesis